MSGSAVDKFLGKNAASGSRVEPKDAGFAAEAGSSPRMLDLVQKSGDRTGLPYAYLVSVKLVGNASIELLFTETKVTIGGRNLATLYQHLLAQTVRRIEENVSGFDDEQRQTSWVESIALQQRS